MLKAFCSHSLPCTLRTKVCRLSDSGGRFKENSFKIEITLSIRRAVQFYLWSCNNIICFDLSERFHRADVFSFLCAHYSLAWRIREGKQQIILSYLTWLSTKNNIGPQMGEGGGGHKCCWATGSRFNSNFLCRIRIWPENWSTMSGFWS